MMLCQFSPVYVNYGLDNGGYVHTQVPPFPRPPAVNQTGNLPPSYSMDTGAAHHFLFFCALVCSGMMQAEGEDYEAQVYIRRYARQSWAPTWCAMLRHNVFACARDMREGVRKPRMLMTGRTGPFPPLDVSGRSTLGGNPRRPSDNALGTANEPVIVVSGRFNKAELSGINSSSGGLLLGGGSEPGGSIAPGYDGAVPDASGLFDSDRVRSSTDGSVTGDASVGGQRSVSRSSSFVPAAWRAPPASDGPDHSHSSTVVANRDVVVSVDGSSVDEKPSESLQSHDEDRSGRKLVSHGPMSSGRDTGEDDSDAHSLLPIRLSTFVPAAGSNSSLIESVIPVGPFSSFVSSHEIETVEADKRSGRELLCHRDVSVETALADVAASSETAPGGGIDQGHCDGSTVSEGREKDNGMASVGLFRTKLPVEGDVLRCSSVGSVGFVNAASENASGVHSTSSFSAEGDCTQGRGLTSSGKRLLYHRDYSRGNGDILSVPSLQEERHDDDEDENAFENGRDISAAEVDRQVSGSGNSAFRLFRGRPPVVSDVPRRGSVGPVGYIDATDGAAVDNDPGTKETEECDVRTGDPASSGKKLLYHRDFSREDDEEPTTETGQDCARDEQKEGNDATDYGHGGKSWSMRNSCSDLLTDEPPVASSQGGSSNSVGYVDSEAGHADGDFVEAPTTHHGIGHASSTGRGKGKAGTIPLVPWSARIPTAVDVPRRRSINTADWHPSQATVGVGKDGNSLRVSGRDALEVAPEEERMPRHSDRQQQVQYGSSGRSLSNYSHPSMESEETAERGSNRSVGKSAWGSGRSGFGLFSNKRPDDAPRRGSMHFAYPVDPRVDGALVLVETAERESSQGSGSSSSGRPLLHSRYHSRKHDDEPCGSQLGMDGETKNGGETSAAAMAESDQGGGKYLSFFTRQEPQPSSMAYNDPEARIIDRDLTETNFGERDSKNGGGLGTSGRAKGGKRGAPVLPWSMRNPITIDVPRRRSIDISGWQPPSAEPVIEGAGGDRREVLIGSSIRDRFPGAISLQQQRHQGDAEHCSGSGSILAAATSSGGAGGGGIRLGLGRPIAVDAPRRRASVYSEGSSTSSSRFIGSNRVLGLNHQNAPPLVEQDEGDQDGRDGVMAGGSTDETSGAGVARRGVSMLAGMGRKKQKLSVSDLPYRQGSSLGPALVLASDADVAVGERRHVQFDAGHWNHDDSD